VLKRLILKQFPLMASAETNDSRHIPSLHLQVRQAIRSWREAAGGRGPGPAEQSADDQERVKEVAQSRRRARERAIGFGTGGVSHVSGGGGSSSSSASVASSVTRADDDDSDVEMEQARTLDEVLKDKFEIAARTGLIIDLDGAGDIDEDELEKEDALAEKEREERLEEHKANGRIVEPADAAADEDDNEDDEERADGDLVMAKALAAAAAGSGRGQRASRRSAVAVNYCEKAGEALTDEDESESESEKEEEPDEESEDDEHEGKRRKLSFSDGSDIEIIDMSSQDSNDDDEAFETSCLGKKDNDENDEDSRLSDIRALLLEGLHYLDLPENPLDDLIDRLGGGDAVAELTGRKERPVKGSDGKVTMERRRPDVGKSQVE
jgi:hypothetical protein